MTDIKRQFETVIARLLAAEPDRQTLLNNLGNIFKRIHSSKLNATKDRLIAIQESLNDSTVR